MKLLNLSAKTKMQIHYNDIKAYYALNSWDKHCFIGIYQYLN